MEKQKKAMFGLVVEVKLHCLAVMCVNNIQHICNLKGVAIDENGVCAGLIKFKPKKKDNTE